MHTVPLYQVECVATANIVIYLGRVMTGMFFYSDALLFRNVEVNFQYVIGKISYWLLQYHLYSKYG